MNRQIFYTNLGSNLKTIRKKFDSSDNKITLDDLVERINQNYEAKLSKGVLSAIEQGKRPVSAFLLFCIAEALNVPVQELIEQRNTNHDKISDKTFKAIEQL